MRFEIRHPSHREELFSERDFVVFGRDLSCDIVVRNPRCSRRHASIRAVPGGFHLLDMGSSNGVYVLGQRVEDAIIREGDVFSMGDVFVRILPDDIPQTLAMPGSKSDATVLQMAASIPPAKWPVEPQPPRADVRPSEKPGPAPLLAPRVLGVASLAVGAALIVGPLSLGAQIGVMAYLLPLFGIASGAAGLALLSGWPWARNLHYGLFTVWTLSCLLAPLGVVGIAYHLRGEDRPDADPFFAIIIGITAAMALVALVLVAFLARIYIPAPLPL